MAGNFLANQEYQKYDESNVENGSNILAKY